LSFNDSRIRSADFSGNLAKQWSSEHTTTRFVCVLKFFAVALNFGMKRTASKALDMRLVYKAYSHPS
jgi:hypothetical protein